MHEKISSYFGPIDKDELYYKSIEAKLLDLQPPKMSKIAPLDNYTEKWRSSSHNIGLETATDPKPRLV